MVRRHSPQWGRHGDFLADNSTTKFFFGHSTRDLQIAFNPAPQKLSAIFKQYPVGGCRALILLILPLLVSGCGGGPDPRLAAPVTAPFENIEQLIDSRKTAQARRQLEPYASPEQPNAIRGQARLGLGRCALAEKNLDEAFRHLDKARKLLPEGKIRARAQLYLGEVLLRKKAVNSALNQLESAFDRLARRDLRTRAAFMIVRTLDESDDKVPTLYRDAMGDAYFPEYSGIWSTPRPTIEKSSGPPLPEKTTVISKPKKLTPPRSRIRLYKRNQWSAKPVRKSSVNPMTRPFRLTVHHTADQSNLESLGASNPREYLQRLQGYCQNNLDWGDIGYHYLISKDGRIWEGRPMKYQGAHAGNHSLNRGNIGVALIGNFDKIRPSTAQIRSLQQLIEDLRTLYKIPPSKIFGHGDLKETGCPGTYLKDVLGELIRRMDDK